MGLRTPELLARVFDEGPLLLAIVDVTGVIVDVSPAWERALGWAREEVVGRHYSAFGHPDEHAEAARQLERSLQGRSSDAAPLRTNAKDGTSRWIRWTSAGRVGEHIVAVGLDVTEQQEARLDALSNRERWRTVVETAPGFVTIVDRDANIEYINRVHPGLTVEQVVGTNLLNWIEPAYREQMQTTLERVFDGAEGLEMLNVGTGEDGGPTWYRTRFGPLRQAGKVVSVVLYGDDVTRQMRAEKARAQAARLEAVGRVAGAIGHDFNNILMATRASVDLLAMELEDERNTAEFEMLRTSIDRASDLTSQLAESLRERPKASAVVVIEDEVRAQLSLLERVCVGRVQLHFEPPRDRTTVHIEPHEVSQILVNLVVNARDAMVDGGNVWVGVRRATIDRWGPSALPAGEYIVLQVRDDGPGIPPEVRERVFDPFFTTKPTGGGFGLATCYGIARSRGGDAELVFPAEGGTCVRIWLPRTDGNVDAAELATSTRPVSTVRDVAALPLVILFAEDDHRARSLVARYFGRLGHVVLEARDGEDALEVAARHPTPIDVLVTDLVMPRRSGLSLVEAMRTKHADLPVIALTGYSGSEELRRFEELGVQVIPKPVSPAQLHLAVEALVREA